MAASSKAASGGGALGTVVIVLLVAALALSGGHHHMAASQGGSSGGNVVPIHSTPGDPCRGMPDDHVAQAFHTYSGKRFTLHCGEWRDLNGRMRRRGSTARASQVFDCIKAAIRNGVYGQRQTAQSWEWRWGAGPDQFALVMADYAGRIVYATPGGNPADIGGSWRQCSAAVRP